MSSDDSSPGAADLHKSAKKKSGKKGKVFSTHSSIMDILNQVNKAEECRLNKKIERQ
ncbi:hypothetical protein LPJ75_005028, partial [Coemansia sp. RSA 2598]